MSFIAGYLMGLSESGGNVDLKPLSVQENGTYYPQPPSAGFNAVYVNVPDRYEEGYEDGRKDHESTIGKYEDSDFIIHYGDMVEKTNGGRYFSGMVQAIVIPQKTSFSNCKTGIFAVYTYSFTDGNDHYYLANMDKYIGYNVSAIEISRGEDETTVTIKCGVTGVFWEYGTQTVSGEISIVFSNRDVDKPSWSA